MKPTVILALLLSVAAVGHTQNWLQRFFSPKAAVVADTIGNLPQQLEGSSSLFLMDGRYWSCNDHGQLTLYAIDTLTAAIVDSAATGVSIYDMEEVAQDDRYIYFGDMGDNNGVRDDLHVLRISKADFAARRFLFDTISFLYPERTDSTARNFDCEAFVATDTALLFFTKQWLDQGSNCYSVPNRPGHWQARRLFSLATEGMVTGACFLPEHRLLLLCGYNSLCIPFLYFSYGFDGAAFDEGTLQRLPLSLGLGVQTEGIATADGLHCYLTCEHLDRYGVNNPAQLFRVDLGEYLGEYLNPSQSIKPAGHGRLQVYPNPTHGLLHVPSHLLESVEVLDTRGSVALVSRDNEWLDLTVLPSSSYLLRLKLKSGSTETIKIVKK